MYYDIWMLSVYHFSKYTLSTAGLRSTVLTILAPTNLDRHNFKPQKPYCSDHTRPAI